MGVIVRRVQNPRAWEADPTTSHDETDALRDFARREVDTDGLSVYEVQDDDDRQVVLAAIAVARDNAGPIDVLEVDRTFVEQFGVLTATTAESPVYAANSLHRSLDWSQEQLDALARAVLAEKQRPRRYSASLVKAAIRRLNDHDVDPIVTNFLNRYRTGRG